MGQLGQSISPTRGYLDVAMEPDEDMALRRAYPGYKNLF
jgi:hypothetical protein